jgi:hypothetical protein
MSQHARRLVAALGLMAALLFAAPSPSRAAGLWEVPALEIAARVRTWLEGWLPAPRRAAAVKGIKQGSGVDPNGTTVPSPSPTSGSTSNQGSGVDPNGTK